MTLNELRPHLQSRLAHEFGLNFLDQLNINVRNIMLEKDTFVSSTTFSKDLARQLSPKLEPDLLMDAFLRAATESSIQAIVKNTIPKGHSYVEMATTSCYVFMMRRESQNTNNAKFYTKKALYNAGLISQSQGDLLALTLIQNDEPLENLLFVCAEAAWESDNEILDISFILPHPTKGYPLLSFSLAELQLSAVQPMTDIAEEEILSIKRRLDQADDDQNKSG